MAITRDMLEAFAPRPQGAHLLTIWGDYLDAILAAQASGEFDRTGINNPDRWCHLLAQWAHECNGFTLLWESGAYSERRILEIFGEGRHSARVTRAEAKRLAALPAADRGPALFERVYGLGNPKKARELGNTEPGDGWRFRGFGIQQITGRRDHEQLVAGDYTASGAVTAALLEWEAKGCNAHADQDDLRRVTRLINGGHNGLANRERWFRKARRVFGGAYPAAGAPDKEHEAAHVHDMATAEEPAPPPAPSVKSSRKYGLAEVWKQILGWLGIGTVGTTAAADVTAVKGTLDAVKLFVASWGVEMLIGACVVGFVSMLLMQHWQKEDFAEGRYTPKGD